MEKLNFFHKARYAVFWISVEFSNMNYEFKIFFVGSN